MTIRKSLFALFLLATLMLIAAPFAEALATSVKTVGEQTKHVAKQISVVPKFIAVVCYVIGVYFSARSLLAFKNYTSDPDNAPITQAISLAVIGALMICLPYAIELMVNTILLDPGQAYDVTHSATSFSTTGK